MRQKITTTIKRAALTTALSLAVVAPATLATPHIASACSLNPAASPTSQVVRPSYGDQATITASYNGSCGYRVNIRIDWGDGTSNQSSSYPTSFKASHSYPTPYNNTVQYTVGVDLLNIGVSNNNAAQVTVIGCPPSCVPTKP